MSLEPTLHGRPAQAESLSGFWTSSPQSRAILDLITDSFVFFDRDWRYVYLNAAAASTVGKRREDLVGKRLWDEFPPSPGSMLAERLQNAMENRKSCRFQVLDDRTGRWYDIHCYPNAEGLAVLYHDVTEQHLAEDLRTALEQRVTLVADAIPAMLAHIDEDHVFRYVNKRFGETFGKPRSQIVGRPLREIIGDEAYALLLPYVEAALSGKAVSYDMPVPLAGPGTRHLSARYVPQQDLIDGKRGFYAFVQDVTEATNVRKKLSESERRLRFTLESANVGTWDWDITSGAVEWSDNLEAIHGRLPGNFAGSFESVQEDIVPEDREHVRQAIERALNDGADYLVHYRVVKHDGGIIWVEGRGRALYDESGRPVRMVGICADVTERKRAEEELHRSQQELRILNATLESRVEERTRELEETVRELEVRNRELQHFAFAASHDLQEPLRKVVTFSDLLKSEYAEKLDSEGIGYISRMQSAARRMSKLLRDLITFSQLTTRNHPFLKVDLNETLAEVRRELEEQITASGARIEASNLGHITGDPVLIRVLLQHLIGNAIKFRRRDVQPAIEIGMAVLPAPESGQSNPQRVLTVRDNGIGFDMQHAERIFAPFQRLHSRDAYEGTGIGLAVCARIAARHGGSIKATSTPGEGSTFTITFPVRD